MLQGCRVILLVVEICCQLTNLYHCLHRLLHNLNAYKLVRSVEVHAAGKDVRTRQSFERQLRSVGSATDRLHLWRYSAKLHCLQYDVDYIHIRVYLLLHVVILVAYGDFYRSLAVFLVHLLCNRCDETLALLEFLAVVVADDIREFSVFDIALDAKQMIESLVALGCPEFHWLAAVR